jgi:Txe/YoeB family toxin of Txe-Axe toxin-antitoxin module
LSIENIKKYKTWKNDDKKIRLIEKMIRKVKRKVSLVGTPFSMQRGKEGI